MSKVVDSFNIRQYAILKLDEMPKHRYKRYNIGGHIFEPVPVYDMPSCIAVESDEDFTGEEVEFV